MQHDCRELGFEHIGKGSRLSVGRQAKTKREVSIHVEVCDGPRPLGTADDVSPVNPGCPALKGQGQKSGARLQRCPLFRGRMSHPWPLSLSQAETSAATQRVQRVPIFSGTGNIPVATRRRMLDSESPVNAMTV